MNIREKLQPSLINHMVTKKGYRFGTKEERDDFVMDVYTDCLAAEKWYDDTVTLPTFIMSVIKTKMSREYEQPKHKAAKEAEHVHEDAIPEQGRHSSSETEVLLSQLQRHMGKELKLLVQGLSVQKIASIMGIHRNHVTKRIKSNRETLRALLN